VGLDGVDGRLLVDAKILEWYLVMTSKLSGVVGWKVYTTYYTLKHPRVCRAQFVEDSSL